MSSGSPRRICSRTTKPSRPKFCTLAPSLPKSKIADFRALTSDDIWLAATTADVPLSCRTRRAAIRHAKQHKSEISGKFLLL